jgi:hypothetical protein
MEKGTHCWLKTNDTTDIYFFGLINDKRVCIILALGIIQEKYSNP